MYIYIFRYSLVNANSFHLWLAIMLIQVVHVIEFILFYIHKLNCCLDFFFVVKCCGKFCARLRQVNSNNTLSIVPYFDYDKSEGVDYAKSDSTPESA